MNYNELYHYGILGMKWGHHRQRESNSGEKTSKAKKTINVLRHPNEEIRKVAKAYKNGMHIANQGMFGKSKKKRLNKRQERIDRDESIKLAREKIRDKDYKEKHSKIEDDVYKAKTFEGKQKAEKILHDMDKEYANNLKLANSFTSGEKAVNVMMAGGVMTLFGIEAFLLVPHGNIR